MTEIEIRQLVVECARNKKRTLSLDEIRELAAVDLAVEWWTPGKQAKWLRVMQAALKLCLPEPKHEL